MARKRNAKIWINGDVFDGLHHKHKHYRPGAIDPACEGPSPHNLALDLALEFLEPYKDLIEGIGCGNHDDNVAKWSGVDLVQLLVGTLNLSGANIKYMGYAGWIVIPIYHATSRAGLKINYHHGSGGGSPVTKGTIAFSRASSWIEGADIIWRGHTHHRTCVRTVSQLLDTNNKIQHRDRLEIRSGAYLNTYQQGDDKGRSYAEDWDVSPAPKGGVFVSVSYDKTCGLSMRGEL